MREAKEEQRQFLINCKSMPANSQLALQFHETTCRRCRENACRREPAPRGKTGQGVGSVGGVGLEDNLTYAEPADWMMPVRHSLGATLLSLGRAAEAELVFREDLVQKSGEWLVSVRPHAYSAEMQRRRGEAASIGLRFNEAWKDAEFQISSSCCCLPGKGETDK